MIKLGKKKDTKEIKEFQTQFLSYGFHLVKCTKLELNTAATGNVKLITYLETKPAGGSFVGFKEQDGTIHEGLIAKADLGVHFDKSNPSKLLSSLTVLAAELGFSDKEMESIEAETLEEFLSGYAKLIKNHYFWIMLKAKEYENNKGAINLNLRIFEDYVGKDENNKSIFQIFCKKESFKETLAKDDQDAIILLSGFDKEGENTGKKRTFNFDKTSKYHYERLNQLDTPDEENDDIESTEDINDSF